MREPADSPAMRLLPALLAVLALVSCGGSADPKADETEAGFTAYEVSSGGFEIAVPTSWRVASSDDATIVNVERFLPLATDVERERASLPAGDGLRVRYEQEADGGQRVPTLQHVLFVDGTGYILTYTTRPDRNAEYERDFTRSAESFRLLGDS
jgi:hypothetical protein